MSIVFGCLEHTGGKILRTRRLFCVSYHKKKTFQLALWLKK